MRKHTAQPPSRIGLTLDRNLPQVFGATPLCTPCLIVGVSRFLDGSPAHPFRGVSIFVRSGLSVTLVVVGVADRSALRATGATRTLRARKHPFSANQRGIMGRWTAKRMRESVIWTLKVFVNDGPQTRTAPTLTLTGPLAAPSGTTATICVSLQLLTVTVARISLRRYCSVSRRNLCR
jgi:hypothetical protein